MYPNLIVGAATRTTSAASASLRAASGPLGALDLLDAQSAATIAPRQARSLCCAGVVRRETTP